MTVKELLVKARNHLYRKGWIQGIYGNVHGPTCAVGALDLYEIGTTRYAAAEMLCKAVGIEPGFVPTAAVINWNDHNGRTKREVTQAFSKAIKLCKE